MPFASVPEQNDCGYTERHSPDMSRQCIAFDVRTSCAPRNMYGEVLPAVSNPRPARALLVCIS